MRIYIESTIPRHLTARPPRDLLQATRQQTTRDCWEFRRTTRELFTSQITLNEISEGQPEMARTRVERLANVAILDLTTASDTLTNAFLTMGILPPSADADAAHVALATVHRMDISRPGKDPAPEEGECRIGLSLFRCFFFLEEYERNQGPW